MATVRPTQTAFELIRAVPANKKVRPTQTAFELIRFTGTPTKLRPTQMAFELIRVAGFVPSATRRRQGNNY